MDQKILEQLNKLYSVNLLKVESVTDEMFRCTTLDNSLYFARITNYKSMEEQLEEVCFTDFLFNEGFGVSPTISSVNGKKVELIKLDNREILTVLYKSAPGIHLPRNQWNTQIFKELGRQIGTLHRLSKKYEDIHPVKYTNDWYDNEEYDFLKFIPKQEGTIREIAKEVLHAVKRIPKNDANYGLIHGDLWLENILMDKDMKLTMIDFQDFEKHFYLYDLIVPIYSALEYSFVGSGNIVDYGQRITKAIMDGYKERNELSTDMLKEIPLFIKLKEIFDYNLMHMYFDKENVTEDQVRILNLYRMRIEQNQSIPII
ncbi:phosphotransferase enzyme family protein [Salirhabdus sp. Marseille-P4669]|uniref:phosphotransferase enzyme family protein n=1 Tax=Salirhabdus sp. Marseille-P4669 TaxID=2042310 RepID=UPI001F27C610|nr:phosphotransferase [Salirhabdus sp. Marseille-P4669]